MEPLMSSRNASQSQDNTQTTSSSVHVPSRHPDADDGELASQLFSSPSVNESPRDEPPPIYTADDALLHQRNLDENTAEASRKRNYDEYRVLFDSVGDSEATAITEQNLEVRMTAFQAMLGNIKSEDWQQVGLLSTDDNHTTEEEELGVGSG
jgi:hypothetical protein